MMQFPVLENVIWTLVVILVIIIVILVAYLKILRTNIRLIEVKKIEYTALSEKLLIEFLYAEEEDVYLSKTQKKVLKTFKKGLSNKRKRVIMTATFFELRQEVSGKMVRTMHKLYEEVGLLNYAVKKLRSKKWHIIALGIRDLRQFKVQKVEGLITKFINHDRDEVRREAHLYFLELFEFEGLNFLDDLKVPLSEWDQIQLLGEIQKFDDSKIKDISKWLESENEYVVMFILSLVKIYNLLETKDILLTLLEHPVIAVRLRTIDVLAHFEVVEAKEILKKKFLTLEKKEKLGFFKLLEKTATIEDSTFAMRFVNDEIFEIRYKALRILRKVDANLYNRLEKTSEDEAYNKIIKFIDYSYGV
jgi:hypothetical protein